MSVMTLKPAPETALLTMGYARDWLPSRRSVDSQRGLLVIDFDGHCRSRMLIRLGAPYFSEGSFNLYLHQHVGEAEIYIRVTYMGMIVA